MTLHLTSMQVIIMVKLQLTLTDFKIRSQNLWFHRLISTLSFSILAPIFVLSKLTCLVTLLDCKLQVFKNSPKLTISSILNELLSTQNVNLARFARNVKCDFFVIFKHRVDAIFIANVTTLTKCCGMSQKQAKVCHWCDLHFWPSETLHLKISTCQKCIFTFFGKSTLNSRHFLRLKNQSFFSGLQI